MVLRGPLAHYRSLTSFGMPRGEEQLKLELLLDGENGMPAVALFDLDFDLPMVSS